MKNRVDALSALILLLLCAVGWTGSRTLPMQSAQEVVGPAALPMLALGGMAFCAVGIFVQAWFRAPRNATPLSPAIAGRILAYFIIFTLYLWGMVAAGDLLTQMEWFPWQHGGGFAVGTALFLLVSLYFLGRRKPWEILLVSFLVTATLLGAFGLLFQVMLP